MKWEEESVVEQELVDQIFGLLRDKVLFSLTQLNYSHHCVHNIIRYLKQQKTGLLQNDCNMEATPILVYLASGLHYFYQVYLIYVDYIAIPEDYLYEWFLQF